MKLTVLGCHGGETPKHRTSSFLVGDRVAIDAGALTGGLSLREQKRIETVLVSHSHFDHIRDLGSLVDNRCQQGGPTLQIAAIAETLESLRAHFFNDKLWPDFTKILVGSEPIVTLHELTPDQPCSFGDITVTPVLVDHTVDTSGFIVQTDGSSVVYSGDTGPTEALWERVNALPDLRALLMEVSFPNDEAKIAVDSCHHTPASLETELKKLRHYDELPILLYHIKPVFEAQVLKDLANINDRDFKILQLGDQFQF